MWSLARPFHSAQLTYSTCISRVRNAGLSARLDAATAAIVTASAEFDLAAQQGAVQRIAPHNIVRPDVTTEEMGTVYTQRMAAVGAPGRDIYDEIFASSAHGRCPLCVQRRVSTLDHHLPKAHFPALAVAPLNLIPACSDCNKAKLASLPVVAEEVGLHPYYDDLGNEVWLTAQVIEARPTALRFSVTAVAAWDRVLTARVQNHFRLLGLASLYASEAAEELSNIKHQLVMLRAADPGMGVQRELARRADSCTRARPNGWRAAAYRAWQASEWFCLGGFE